MYTWSWSILSVDYLKRLAIHIISSAWSTLVKTMRNDCSLPGIGWPRRLKWETSVCGLNSASYDWMTDYLSEQTLVGRPETILLSYCDSLFLAGHCRLLLPPLDEIESVIVWLQCWWVWALLSTVAPALTAVWSDWGCSMYFITGGGSIDQSWVGRVVLRYIIKMGEITRQIWVSLSSYWCDS
jgi:hypothetical protein